MSRSKYKPFFISFNFIRRFDKIFNTTVLDNKIPIKVYKRSTVILDNFIGYTFEIYNGLFFNRLIQISNDCKFFNFGMFSLTKQTIKNPFKRVIKKKNFKKR